jgi:hypothetical protein
MMEHSQAAQAHTVERYLLGELSEDERASFEDHYFSCGVCAAEVTSGAAFLANLKPAYCEAAEARPDSARGGRWWSRWFEWSLAPQTAAAALAILSGVVVYQNAVQIPRIRSGTVADAPVLSITPSTRARANRAGEALTFSKASGTIGLTITHEWEESYERYAGELKRENGSVVARATIRSTSQDLIISISTRNLETGRYTLVINGIKEEGGEGVAIERIPLRLTK